MESQSNLHATTTKIQCAWRGHSTRKLLNEVYEQYREVVIAIDGQLQASNICNKMNPFLLRRPPVKTNVWNKEASSDISASSVNNYENTFESSIVSEEISESPETSAHVDQAELLKSKRHLAMELVWIQQAIESRKNYLQIKEQFS